MKKCNAKDWFRCDIDDALFMAKNILIRARVEYDFIDKLKDVKKAIKILARIAERLEREEWTEKNEFKR